MSICQKATCQSLLTSISPAKHKFIYSKYASHLSVNILSQNNAWHLELKEGFPGGWSREAQVRFPEYQKGTE